MPKTTKADLEGVRPEPFSVSLMDAHERAVADIAAAALWFAQALANQQGAADTQSMRTLFAEAKERYEQLAEEEFS